MDWPEIGGKPAARVKTGAAEKIGLPKFSNIDLGPITIERFCEDTPDARAAAIKEAQLECETLLAEEREIVLKWLREQGIDRNDK